MLLRKMPKTNRIVLLSQDNWTALLFATREGHDEIVADLLDHGAAVDHRDMVSFNFKGQRYNNLVSKYVHIIRSCYLSFRGDGQL
jgi:uncharacterized protein YqjF (DUF2071 family)